MRNEELDSTRIKILLKEYELCHQNKDHYDKIGWQIGSILIALSLAALWIAVDVWTKKIMPTKWFVVPLFIFSIWSVSTWILYSYRVRPFILASLDRCKKIEDKFRQLDLGEQLHSKIRRYNDNRSWPRLKGIHCLWLFFSGVLLAWVLLILLIFELKPLVNILPLLVGFLIIPAFPQVRGLMFKWDTLGKGKRKEIGAWYGGNWHTILLCSYIAIFVLPVVVGYWWYGYELFKDVKGPCSLIVVGFTIVIFVHFQWPLITKPRIFAVVMASKEDGDMYIPDGKVAKEIEVPKGISLVFIRITNLGVNTYKNSGIILDFPQKVKILPSSDTLYQKTAWSKNFKIFRPGYIFFDPTLNYQTIVAREHILLPIWIETKVAEEGNITIYFHCETRSGEASEKLGLTVK